MNKQTIETLCRWVKKDVYGLFAASYIYKYRTLDVVLLGRHVHTFKHDGVVPLYVQEFVREKVYPNLPTVGGAQ